MGNVNTTFFENLAAGATWSAGVAFQRSKGLPLDKYSVFATKALAEEYAEQRGAYAETPVSYPGQVIAVAENGKMVAYVLAENAEGTKLELQQIGIIPTGDDKTIDVTEDGKISLLAADVQVDEIGEDGTATGNKVINTGAQLILQADGTLKWVQPDTTTAEGQAAAISALQGRTDALEKAAIKPAADAEAKPDENLWDAIAAEAERAAGAEDALGKRIDAANEAIGKIDFVDNDELATALEPYAKTEDVNKTLEDYAKTADVNTELAKKADKAAYDQTVIDLDNLEAKVDAFLSGTGATDAIDSLQELITYINEHDDVDIAGIMEDIQAIETKLTLGTNAEGKEYATVKAYVEAAIEALKIGDYAKAADLTALAGRVTTLEGKVDVEKVSTAIADAIDQLGDLAEKNFSEIQAELAGDIGTAGFVSGEQVKTELDKKANVGDAYTKGEIDAMDLANKTHVANAVAAEAEIARAAEKANADAIKAIKDHETVDSFADVVAELAKKQDKLTEGAYATEKFVEDKVKVATDAAAAADAKGAQGIADAAAAKAAADEAQADANTNALNIQEIEKEINGYTTDEGQTVEGLNAKVASNTQRIGTLEGAVNGDTGLVAKVHNIINTELPKKAEASDLNTLKGRVDVVEDTLNNESTGLVKKVADNAAAIQEITKTDGTIDTKVEAAIEALKLGDTYVEEEGFDARVAAIKVTNAESAGFALEASQAHKAAQAGTANVANKVDHAITVKVGGADVVFDGSEAKTADVDAAIKAAVDAIPEVVHPEYSVVKDESSTDYAAVYHLTKDGVNVGAAINIPKDMVVESGSVVTNPEGQKAGTYIELVLANATNDTLYIPVGDLIEYVTSGSAATDMVVIAIDADHKVTATITDGAITETKLEKNVTDALALARTALQSHQDISGKADKVVGATAGNLAGLDENGNLVDSGKKADDFATKAQGDKADTAIQEVAAGDGLKTTVADNKVTIDIDDDVIFVFNGGSATSAW